MPITISYVRGATLVPTTPHTNTRNFSLYQYVESIVRIKVAVKYWYPCVECWSHPKVQCSCRTTVWQSGIRGRHIIIDPVKAKSLVNHSGCEGCAVEQSA